MKKMVTTLFILCACLFGSSTYASSLVEFKPDLERLEFDVVQPVHITDLNAFKNYHSIKGTAELRLNLFETKIGKVGIEADPIYDISTSVLSSSAGVYYTPIKWVQIHYDHGNDFKMTGLGNSSWKGTDTVGVRIIVKE